MLREEGIDIGDAGRVGGIDQVAIAGYACRTSKSDVLRVSRGNSGEHGNRNQGEIANFDVFHFGVLEASY